MYLKSIEVQGFKSFANKLRFEFQRGITGIVGPNGSGKSNVADAVRWVLGEQSAKQLRGGSMQDVIFSGTETRRPQSFAQVAITFDNSDHTLDIEYEEVTVTRRLYRSGESEYLLNNTAVRLRDIHEIFYDTGIGQEGYSIIGQGQIDRILSGRAEERRELFDEAAGIVKFKKRKTEALRKLDREHQNLLRVDDILKELSSQLAPLKAQSETATAYLEKRDKLKEADIRLYLMEEERCDSQIRDLAGKIDICEADMAGTREKFDRTKSEYEEIERQIGELENRISAAQEELAEMAVARSDMSGRAELLGEQVRSAESAGDDMLSRRQQIAAEIDRRTGEAAAVGEELRGENEKAEEAAASEAAAMRELKETDSRIEETVRGLERARESVIGMLQSRAQVKGKGQRYDTLLEQMGIRRSEISGRLLSLEEDRAKAETEAGELDAEIAELSGKAEELRKLQEESEKKIAALQGSLQAKTKEIDETTAAYHRDSSRLESLRAMSERYEGYSEGIRRIMESRTRNPGIRGVVADLIAVPEKYETAIETALGGSLRNIVTDNETTAKYQIEFLKSNRLGRATFLPLTSIRPRTLGNRDVLSEQGVIGLASELVSTDEDYGILSEHLLGRTIVVDTADHAILIGRKYRHSHYMVTLQGESFAPGGSITGGAFRNKENLLGRKREIEELTASSEALRKKLGKLRIETDDIRAERNSIRDGIAEHGEMEQTVLLRLNTLTLSRKQAGEKLEESAAAAGKLEREAAEITSQMEEVSGKNGMIAETLRQSEREEDEARKRGEELRRQEEELREIRNRQAEAAEAARLEAEKLRQSCGFRRETVERLRREIAGLMEEAAGIEERITGNASDIEEKKREMALIAEAIADSGRKSEERTAERDRLTEEKNRLSSSHRDFFERRDGLSDRMSRLDREFFHLTQQREKLSVGREERANHMWEEYNMTPSEVRAVNLPEKGPDRQTARRTVQTLREEIRALGNVNVNAIEEYRAVNERYTFLSSQHDDLVKSEETLQGIIVSLDRGMRRQFTEKFAEIREEFDKSFRELFGGGHGTLEIDTDADLLEAGISIIAHPPGKKLQNMMQLSGGERALTAIALLFAIQNLKPSPFCLLDEIEAALDETNVIRFADYLHKLTDNTQFIVITHRRGTMTAADRLYGITMQEKGVSALVSVSLIEDKLS